MMWCIQTSFLKSQSNYRSSVRRITARTHGRSCRKKIEQNQNGVLRARHMIDHHLLLRSGLPGNGMQCTSDDRQAPCEWNQGLLSVDGRALSSVIVNFMGLHGLFRFRRGYIYVEFSHHAWCLEQVFGEFDDGTTCAFAMVSLILFLSMYKCFLENRHHRPRKRMLLRDSQISQLTM